jgi:hypothetical protein
MIEDADRARVVKLLGMLTSEFDGERANAGAFLSKIALRYKLTIPQLCGLATAPPAPPAPPETVEIFGRQYIVRGGRGRRGSPGQRPVPHPRSKGSDPGDGSKA